MIKSASFMHLVYPVNQKLKSESWRTLSSAGVLVSDFLTKDKTFRSKTRLHNGLVVCFVPLRVKKYR